VIENSTDSRLLTRATIRSGLSAASMCVAAGLCGVVLLIAGARWATPPTLSGPVGDAWRGRAAGWYTTEGVFGAEIQRDTDRQFSWTGQTARLRFPHLDRAQAYVVTLQVVAGRGANVPPPPQLGLFVDGQQVGAAESSNIPKRLAVRIPRGVGDGAEVTLVASSTFVPGPDDSRVLGVMIEDLRLTPAGGHFRPSWSVAARTGLAILVCVAGLLLCGLRSRLALLAAAGVAGGLSWLLLQDAAFLGTYVDRLLNIAIGVALIGALVAVARIRWPLSSALPEWSVAVGLVLCASAVKLAFFTHPQVEVHDAAFQVHRAEFVHAGMYFFTSITPSPAFEFPYAIALYVTALPFWRFFPTFLDLAALLRGLALGADALVGLALYAAARRQWNDRVTALLAAALWPFARASAQALGYANLTNLFGQGVFGVAMGLLAWTAAGSRTSRSAVAAVAGVLVVAFLSHFGTLLIGVSILATVGLILIGLGRAHLRSLGVWVLIVMLAAAAVSYGVYYSHFNEIYRKTITRVISGEDKQATESMVAPVGLKALRWITEDQFSNDYGLPGLPLFLAASGGAVLLARTRRREGVTLLLAGWALVWVSFSALGILSRVELRTNLAAAPMFISLGAYALGTVASRSRAGTAVAAVGVVAVAWSGVHVWLTSLGR
jgi:hypothetical protein